MFCPGSKKTILNGVNLASLKLTVFWCDLCEVFVQAAGSQVSLVFGTCVKTLGDVWSSLICRRSWGKALQTQVFKHLLNKLLPLQVFILPKKGELDGRG